MKKTVTIIGAGIGGLTTALTLKQKGIESVVFEASAEIKSVGAGIIIANNAMQIFKKLGVDEQIKNAGNFISRMKLTNPQLETISFVELSDYEKKYGVKTIAIHRGELQKILSKELGYENICLSKKLTRIEKTSNFKLTFEDHSSLESRILIGADGIKSVVRNQLFGKSMLRNAQQICWRGVCEIDLPQKYNHELNEALGKGKRFGFVKINDKKVYWYALANEKIIESRDIDLLEFFKEFNQVVLNIISSTDKGKIIVGNIFDLEPIFKWQDKNVCLIGDAAHAATPNLGQGACQAIEDAYVIGKLIDEGFSLEKTFQNYENLRRKKAHDIVNISWRFGKLLQLENGLAITLRNFLMKIAPKNFNKKQLQMIFKID